MKNRKIFLAAAVAVVVIIAIIITLVAIFGQQTKDVVNENLTVEVYYDGELVQDAGLVIANQITVDTDKIPVIAAGQLVPQAIESLGYSVIAQTYGQLTKVYISKASETAVLPEDGEIIYTLQEEFPEPETNTEAITSEVIVITDETTSAITVPVEESVVPTETQTPVVVTTKPQTPVVTTKPQTPAVTTKPPVTTVKPQTTPAVTTKPVSSTEKLAAVKVIDASNPANLAEMSNGPLAGQMVYNTFSRKTTHGTRFTYPGLTYDTSKTVLLNQENYSELLYKATGACVTYNLDTNTVDDGGHDGVTIYTENDIFRIYVASHRNNFHGTTQDGIDYMLIGNQFLQALAYFGGEDFGDAVWSVFDEYCWVIANNDYTQPIDDTILNKYGFTLVKQGLIGDTAVIEAWWKYGNTTICVSYPCDNDLGHYAPTAVNVWFPALGSGKTLTEANLFY